MLLQNGKWNKLRAFLLRGSRPGEIIFHGRGTAVIPHSSTGSAEAEERSERQGRRNVRCEWAGTIAPFRRRGVTPGGSGCLLYGRASRGRAPFPFRTPVGCMQGVLPSPFLARGSFPCSEHLFPRQVKKTGPPWALFSLHPEVYPPRYAMAMPSCLFTAVAVADGAAAPSARCSCRAAHVRSPAASSQLSFLPSAKKHLGSHLLLGLFVVKDRGVQAGFAWQTDGGTTRTGAEAHSLNCAAI